MPNFHAGAATLVAVLPTPRNNPPRPRRTSPAQKLELLRAGVRPEFLDKYLRTFVRLFAFRQTDAIVTLKWQGPRSWTKLRGLLSAENVVKHLLADRLPGWSPVWYGARSFTTTKWFAIDVDPDRGPAPAPGFAGTTAAAVTASPSTAPKPASFAARCLLVERALRRMGINTANPRNVLILPTPSGGKHFYIFLTQPHELSRIHSLLKLAGLEHRKGETEFFPSTTHAFRLPFGLIPGHPHDPRAWMRFIKRYRTGKFRRYRLQSLIERLEKHRLRWQRQHASRAAARKQNDPPPRQTGSKPPPTRIQLPEPAAVPRTEALRHYDQLLENGIRNTNDANELLSLGIQREGTRTAALKLLATHLIWFRNLTATDAERDLTAWTNHPGHKSADIAADRANGTTVVADHIRRLCRWYEAHKNGNRNPSQANAPIKAQLTAAETNTIDAHARQLGGNDPYGDAIFLRCLLTHAKHYGQPLPNGRGYEVGLPINDVVRKWPGCHHTNYRDRIERAVKAGVLTLHKDKWQNPRGPGRARTYHLWIPAETTHQTDDGHAPDPQPSFE